MPLHPKSEQIAQRVKYEFDMFEWLAGKIQGDWETAPQPMKNLLLEGFLLHARILRDFFIADPKQDDVSARHFFDDPSQWRARSSSLCPYLKANTERLNKKLAHLTYSRLTEEEQWDFRAIQAEIALAREAFRSALTESTRQWFV